MPDSLSSTKSIKLLHRLYDLRIRNVKYEAKSSEIQVFNLATRDWETIIETKGARHAAVAEYIAFEIELYHELLDHIEEALNAFKLCLDCSHLSWEAEQASELIAQKIEQMLIRTNRMPRKRRARAGS